MGNLVESLLKPSAYPHPVDEILLVETHISLVFLTGPYAYKIKKPLNLGFLDFSTLEKREYYCREELRRNRVLCGDLYLDVIPVTEQPGSITIGGKGGIIDYAVQMIQFDRRLELDTLLSEEKLTGEHIDEISRTVALFHENAPSAEPDTPFGRPEILIRPVRDNFTESERLSNNPDEIARLEQVGNWTENEFARLRPLLLSRKENGSIRQCHGDMHTGNMVVWKGKVMIFDCIEFNSFLCTIDVISEIAFLVMDLEHSGHPEHAWRFLNSYLSYTGDYEGLALLRFYKTYRAMVRAKVTAIRLLQETDPYDKKATRTEHCSYVETALASTTPGKASLIITCGVSGSGKTTFARDLASRLQAVHIRSDVERKRLFGLGQLIKSNPELNRQMYSSKSSESTYSRLFDLAVHCLENRYPVVVDATFLHRDERARFLALGKDAGVPANILFFETPETLLLERVRKRLEKGKDASEADCSILRQQFGEMQPLQDAEKNRALMIDTSRPSAYKSSMKEVLHVLREKQST